MSSSDEDIKIVTIFLQIIGAVYGDEESTDDSVSQYELAILLWFLFQQLESSHIMIPNDEWDSYLQNRQYRQELFLKRTY